MMPSFDSKEIIDQLLANDGCYEDDPQAIQVAKYENASGGTTYHVAYRESEIIDLFVSPFVGNVEVLWRL
jgi:hypothetical protein